MNIERKSAGEYFVRDGERAVHLTKGLNRKWNVEPVEGVAGKAREVASYSEAKTVAENMIRRAMGEPFAKADTIQPKPARGKPTAERATDALAAADVDTVKLQLSERLKQFADELLN